MKLIADWRQSWRLWSVRVSAIATALFAIMLAAPDQVLGIWAMLPADVQELIPNRTAIAAALSVASLVARLIKQREAVDGDR